MKTIEERAKEYAPDPFLAALERKAYIAGATEQKAIDDEANYKQGFNDATKKACELLKAVGVLTDDDSIMGFIKAMEE